MTWTPEDGQGGSETTAEQEKVERQKDLVQERQAFVVRGGSKGRIETYNERPEAEEGEEGAEAEAEGKPA